MWPVSPLRRSPGHSTPQNMLPSESCLCWQPVIGGTWADSQSQSTRKPTVPPSSSTMLSPVGPDMPASASTMHGCGWSEPMRRWLLAPAKRDAPLASSPLSAATRTTPSQSREQSPSWISCDNGFEVWAQAGPARARTSTRTGIPPAVTRWDKTSQISPPFTVQLSIVPCRGATKSATT